MRPGRTHRSASGISAGNFLRGILFVIAMTVATVHVATAQQRPNVLDLTYRHDRYGTKPADIIREFRAFTTSFDSDDDDDGDGASDVLGIPQWVAQEIRRASQAPESNSRPQTWFSDQDLVKRRLAPLDASYAYSAAFRKQNPDWFDRGHMAQKYLAERMGADAAWNTHTVLNAVPQRSRFNSGPWLQLECTTGAWANRFGVIWIVTGPIFNGKRPSAWIGEPSKGELSVAIPDFLFKVVIREISVPPGIDILAFIYPQTDQTYAHGPWDPTKWLTTVDRVERLSGLNLLTNLSTAIQNSVERKKAKNIWPLSKADFDPGCVRFAADYIP